MRDYLLLAIPGRLAVTGEALAIHSFEAGSVGFASVLDIQRGRQGTQLGLCSRLRRMLHPRKAQQIPAIWVPPGARLLIQDIPEKLQRECGFQEEAEEAVFTEIIAVGDIHRDAIRFQNGVVVLLQRLSVGQRVRVLDFSSAEDRPINLTGQRRERSIAPQSGN
jgi:hypothetical protein